MKYFRKYRKNSGAWALNYRHPKLGWMIPYFIPEWQPKRIVRVAYYDYVARWGINNVSCNYVEN